MSILRPLSFLLLACSLLAGFHLIADADEDPLREVTVFEQSVPGFVDLKAVGQVDAQNFRQGEWTWYWRNYGNRVARTGYYSDGKRVLDWTFRDTQGRIIKSGDFANDREIGCWRLFDSSGQESGFIKYWEWDGHYWSLATEYYDTGAPIYTSLKQDGLQHGTYSSYYANGQVLLSCSYKLGKKDGPFEWRREDGSLAMLATFKAGLHEGLFTEFHANGKVSETGAFAKGKEVGIWRKYDEEGAVIESIQYDE